ISELDINPLIVSETSAVAVDARVVLNPVRGLSPKPRGSAVADPITEFMPLFAPKTVAVIGASTKGTTFPNVFIRRIREFGFEGPIYPIHPSAPEIDGLPAYKSLAETPGRIDYAFIAIPAGQIPPLLSAARGRLRFAQVISSGFGEVEEGRDLQEKLAEA